ncbi:MAG: ABC transporter permease [Dehalococcoidales bacterium]|nr:ABC transporter permease [Dehalococcoidales bacterium]
MNWRIIGTLVSKDLSLFFRKKLIMALTALGLVFYLVIYFVMPSSVNENLKIGLYAPVIPPVFEQVQEEGLEIEVVESEEALKEAVAEGQYIAGVVLPADLMEKFQSGQKPKIILYFTPDAPEEIKDAVEVLIKELAYLQTGQTLAIDISEEILGPDMVGMPIPPRDRLRPLLAILIIMMEMLGLANLISEEVERRTVHALLVTPMTVIDLFVAKGITGVGLAFVQAVLFMSIVGGMSRQPLIILVALLLGAVLVTGVGFIIAAVSKDFMSVLGWGVLSFIILLIPSFSVIAPGVITGWIKILPSYYLVDTVHRAANFGSGWGDVGINLLILLGFSLAILWIGITVLRRKFQ